MKCTQKAKAKESCEEWHCFDLSLLPRSLIGQFQKTGMQVAASEEDTCDQNKK